MASRFFLPGRYQQDLWLLAGVRNFVQLNLGDSGGLASLHFLDGVKEFQAEFGAGQGVSGWATILCGGRPFF